MDSGVYELVPVTATNVNVKTTGCRSSVLQEIVKDKEMNGTEREHARTRRDQEEHLIMAPAALTHAGRKITSSDTRSLVPKTANINL